MAYLVGVLLALGVGGFASVTGLDRDRAFYPTVMIVIAFYYALFALIGGSLETLALESIAIVVFVAAAVAGFKASPWLVVAALAAHGVFDLGHDSLITNTGVPGFWPAFCFAYDLTAAAYLGWLLSRSGLRAS